MEDLYQGVGDAQQQLKTYTDNPARETKRQRLMRRKAEFQVHLATVQKALDALDSHPELEEFIETMTNAGI